MKHSKLIRKEWRNYYYSEYLLHKLCFGINCSFEDWLKSAKKPIEWPKGSIFNKILNG